MNKDIESRGAVFLDRDGTLIEDAHHLRKKEDIRLLPGACEAVNQINQAGIPAIIVTNQSVVARGWLTGKQVIELHLEVNRLFERNHAHFDAFYFCPHHPEIGNTEYQTRCECRKPNPGMLLDAAREMNLDLSQCVMIGDSDRDVVAGQRAGCKTVLIREENESGGNSAADTVAGFIASDILQAVSWALEKIY